VLLHTFPLHALRAGDSRVDEDRRHYDSLLLALKVMDLIVENAGLETEVDRAAVNRVLEPLLTKMDEASGLSPDTERHRLAIDRVLGGLRNDDDRRRPFSILYQDFDDSGSVVTRRLDFRLAFDQFRQRVSDRPRARNSTAGPCPWGWTVPALYSFFDASVIPAACTAMDRLVSPL
jgi:hypothetical protein